MPTQRRLCVFCSNSGGFSKEHVWPQWLHAYAADVDKGRRWTHEAGFGQTDADTFSEMPTTVTERPGSVLTMKTREVCRLCNNGWMSQLEMQVRPLLLSLTEAAAGGWSRAIAPEEAARVATWAVKTAWMRELSAGTLVNRREDYQYLRERLLPPPECRVWLGRHAGGLNFNIRQATVQVRRSDRAWDDGDIRNVLWSCMTFGGVSLLVYSVDGWGVPTPDRDQNRWRPLWPQSSPVRFPTRFDVSEADILEAVAIQSSSLRLPDLPIFERDPEGIRFQRRN